MKESDYTKELEEIRCMPLSEIIQKYNVDTRDEAIFYLNEWYQCEKEEEENDSYDYWKEYEEDMNYEFQKENGRVKKVS